MKSKKIILLESLFLKISVPAWSSNLGKRLIKAPKVYVSDINLLTYLLNSNLGEIFKNNKTLFGQILESYVAIELSKQITFSKNNVKLFHFRTSNGQEVDFVLEGPDSKIVGIEVKAKEVVDRKDFT